MGKFINTNRKSSVDSLVEGTKQRLDNPYYLSMNKSPLIVTYFNINTLKTTYDPNTGLVEKYIGENSPIRFNKIENMFLYGDVERLTLDLEDGDWGLSSTDIEMELILLPNTIKPYPNDYFYINQVKEKYLFKVTNVATDTFDTGANFYKITCKLDKLNYETILPQVVEEYTMIVDNFGGNLDTIVNKSDYNLIEILEVFISTLKNYYMALFFDTGVQTFIFHMDGRRFYDPFLIEFLIRNRILEGSDEYQYITQQINLPATFIIDYDKSIFRAVELKNKEYFEYDKNTIDFKISRYAHLIDQKFSLLYSRIEDYYVVDEYRFSNPNVTKFSIIDKDAFIDICRDKKNDSIYDIFINFLNDIVISKEDLDLIENNIDYANNINIFYYVPMLIFILEDYIKTVLREHNYKAKIDS